MTTKLVIRILDAGIRLLGWAEVQAEMRGDGCLTVDAPTLVPVDDSGVPAWLSVHWCDVNVETRSRIETSKVRTGDMFTVPGPWVAITVGAPAGGLPPVTVRSAIRVAVPTGVLGGLTH